MATGTVNWFNATKGFGFIQPDTGGKDVFVHISAVERAGLSGLNDGQKVSYDEQSERGQLSCPTCNSVRIEKAIMAPTVSGTKKSVRSRAEAKQMRQFA